MKPRTIAIIPARAGSKSIPKKNLAQLCGKPLIYYVIDSAKRATSIDEIIISSDDDEILSYATSLHVKTLLRPHELASDEARSEDVLLHALGHYPCDNAVLLQPTSPFCSASNIDEAFALFHAKKASAVISVSAIESTILKAFVLDDKGALQGICNDAFPFTPRQLLPQTYKSNGAIYIIQAQAFLQHPTFLPPHTYPYIMDSTQSLDIDTQEDLIRANRLCDVLYRHH